MNEAQLNALTGLLHYMNGRKDSVTRSEQDPPAPKHGGLSFDVAVYDEEALMGSIKHDGDEYRLYPGLGNR